MKWGCAFFLQFWTVVGVGRGAGGGGGGGGGAEVAAAGGCAGAGALDGAALGPDVVPSPFDVVCNEGAAAEAEVGLTGAGSAELAGESAVGFPDAAGEALAGCSAVGWAGAGSPLTGDATGVWPADEVAAVVLPALDGAVVACRVAG